MKFDQILEAQEQQKLDEVRMGKSDLDNFVDSPEADGIRAGFEAEVVFPGLGGDSGELDYENGEPDWTTRESISNIEDACEFFYDGDHNSGREIRELKEELQQAYYDWLSEQLGDKWEDEKDEVVQEYIQENEFDEYDFIENYLSDELGLTPEQVAMAMAVGKDKGYTGKHGSLFSEEEEMHAHYVEAQDAATEELEELVKNALNDENSDYDRAREMWEENVRDESEFNEEAYFESQGWHDTEDLYDNFARRYVQWPYWDYPPIEGGFDEYEADKLAKDWKERVNDFVGPDPDTGERMYQTRVSSGYHSATRADYRWIFEPDSSLEPDNTDDMPVEIISPPMPLKETLRIIPEFFQWLKDNGAYTNSSTGLHVGVSLPHQGGKIDYVKLAMFLGDQYLLDKFDRGSNGFCQSALKKIRDTSDPEKILETFDLLQSDLAELAAHQLKQTKGHGKYTSINIKPDYVEFRIMGAGDEGQDYIKRLDDVMDTVKRYAYAMHIAGRPDLHRKEYAKKLYKNLSESLPKNEQDAVMRLSMIMANSSKLSPDALESQLELLRATLVPIQQKREQNRKFEELAKQYPLDTTPWHWRITLKGWSGPKAEIVATGRQEAIANVKHKEGWPWIDQPVNKFHLEPISPVSEEHIEKTFTVTDPTTGETMFTLQAHNARDAIMMALTKFNNNGKIETEFEIKNPNNQVVFYNTTQNRGNMGWTTMYVKPSKDAVNSDGPWKVVSNLTGDTVMKFSRVIGNQAEALAVSSRWLNQNRDRMLSDGQGARFTVAPDVQQS